MYRAFLQVRGVRAISRFNTLRSNIWISSFPRLPAARGLKSIPKPPSNNRVKSSSTFYSVGTFLILGGAGINICFCEKSISENYASGVEQVKSEKEKKVAEPNTSSKEDNGATFTLLLDYMKDDAFLYFLAAIASILSSVFMTSQARLFGSLFDILGTTDALNRLYLPVKRLLGLFILQAALSFSSSFVLALAANRLGTRLRENFFQSVMTLDIEFFDVNKTGEVTHQLTEDIGDLQSAVRTLFTAGIEGLTSLISGSVYLYLASPKIALCMLSILPIMTIAANGFGILLRQLSDDVRKATTKATGKATESISSIRTVRSFGGEEFEIEQYKNALREAVGLKRLMSLAAGGFYAVLVLGVNMIALVICGYGGYLVETGELTRGGVASIATQVQMLERSIARLSMVNAQLVKALRTSAHVFEVMRIIPRVNTSAGGENLVLRKEVVRGDIEFNGVTFVYPNRPENVVLSHFNLKIPSGKVLALVGPSGSGKTTVTSLLERFYDPKEGEITIDGIDLRDIQPKNLHSLVGTVAQEPVLFATSIMENIRYGNPSATEEEVREAARQANAHNFIELLQDGYDTILGERGSLLSGGQKQRIAIARAILSDPKILILDEATSALDNQSEQLVQEALSKLMKGRTVVIVAHRLTTIKDADIICVMRRGEIIESGTHKELITVKDGHYRSLFRRQNSSAL